MDDDRLIFWVEAVDRVQGGLGHELDHGMKW